MRKMAVKEWTCSLHDYPKHCDECGTWHCSECATSEWLKVGERDASSFEEMLFAIPLTRPFPRSIVAEQIRG